MSQLSTSYTSEKLYEEAYNIQYNWDKILPLDVLEFHTLVSKQTNAPVDLQMGTILPFGDFLQVCTSVGTLQNNHENSHFRFGTLTMQMCCWIVDLNYLTLYLFCALNYWIIFY